jgi:hypothetical protein
MIFQLAQGLLFSNEPNIRLMACTSYSTVPTDPSCRVPNDEGGLLSYLQDDGFGPFRGEMPDIFGIRRFIYKRIVSDVIDGIMQLYSTKKTPIDQTPNNGTVMF